MRSLIDITSGMSCSITSMEAPSSSPHLEQERPERLGLPLGDAGGGLVEAEHPGVRREEARQLDDPAQCRWTAR